MTNYDDLQKRLQRGSSQIHEANNLIAEAYGVIGALVAENESLRKALLEASEEVAAWGAYASEYFQKKHDLAGCVERIHQAAISKGAQS